MQKKINDNENFLKSAGPLLLVLFIDGMGLGLVIPIINGLIFDSNFIPVYLQTPTAQNILYGFIIGVFMLCWFFGAAILGDLSDSVGRKKSLLICLFGSFLSNVISALAILMSSITLLFIGRIIGGFTSGSQPIAQAAIIDLSNPATKTRNIGYILLAVSLGFIVGPLLGGVLSDHRIVSWFNFAVPFYFAATISLLNMLLLVFLFKETFVSRATTYKINIYHAIDIFISAFRDMSVRSLSIIFFLYIFGWSSFYSFISLYMLKVHHFTPTQISLFMAVMGIGFGVGNGYLTNFFAKFFPLINNFIVGTLLSGIIAILFYVIPSTLFCWLAVAPLAATVAVAYASIVTLFSNQVDDAKQGWVMGITGSIMAFVWAINGIIVGMLAIWNDTMPILISGICLILTVIITPFLFNTTKDRSKIIKH